MNKVTACIDGTNISPAVCDYAAWASLHLDAPLTFLHVLDKSEYPVQPDLSGNIGLGSREALLEELAALDEKRGKLALEQGRLMLEAAQERTVLDGVTDPVALQRHGGLVETLLVMGKHDENLGEHIGSRLENVVRTMHRPILVTTPAFSTRSSAASWSAARPLP
ncbi:MAG: universal stress protein [Thiogranum sp.]|nr:universal stress protein [Thiogranum sp.]